MARADVKNAPHGNPAPPRDAICRRFAATLALKRLARMWTAPILLTLADRPRRFAELERELAPISAKVLAQRLRELEADGFITRIEIVSDPPKTVIYRLSEIGEAIRPVLSTLETWSATLRQSRP